MNAYFSVYFMRKFFIFLLISSFFRQFDNVKEIRTVFSVHLQVIHFLVYLKNRKNCSGYKRKAKKEARIKCAFVQLSAFFFDARDASGCFLENWAWRKKGTGRDEVMRLERVIMLIGWWLLTNSQDICPT